MIFKYQNKDWNYVFKLNWIFLFKERKKPRKKERKKEKSGTEKM